MAALARLAPAAADMRDKYLVADTRPSNVGNHGAYDIYVAPKRGAPQIEQIHTHMDAAEFLETYGEDGVRALAEILEDVGGEKYRKYVGRLRAEGSEKNRKLVAKALAAVFREYPKARRFWKELAGDFRDLLRDARRDYPSTKTIFNLERQIKYLERKKDPYRVKAWYAAEILKNMLKMWAYGRRKDRLLRRR